MQGLMLSNVNHILIIEDELILADYLRSSLENMGYDVAGIACSYEASVELIDTLPVDLAIIDIQLEGEKSGIDVARYIRRKYEFMPFIYLSSYLDKETIESIKLTNPAGYLTKPFTYTSIFAMIEVALHNSRTLRKV